MIKQSKDALIVRTLGDFSITWQGQKISGGSRDSQFTRLMEILLHYSEIGVERTRLEEMLFEDSSSADPHHMLRSVIYNAKKKLEKAGLPGSDCIVFHSGVYSWTKEIPVIEDARQFEEMVRRASETMDPNEKADLYQEACFLYRGEFLPDQTRNVWVMQEERRYYDMFCRSMEQAIEYHRAHGNYMAIEKLGRYATKVHPLSDWETVTMEALLGLNRFDEASELYEKTADYYLAELGVRPAFAGMNVLEQIASRMENTYSMLDEIQMFLTCPDDEIPGGGYLCSLPVFQGIYRMFERMIDRTGQSVYLMLCTIVNGKGHPMKEGAVLNRLSERLADAICMSVRHSDVVCRYSKSQYLVLLIDTAREDCSIVQKRIDKRFRTDGQRTGLQYHVTGVNGKYL